MTRAVDDLVQSVDIQQKAAVLNRHRPGIGELPEMKCHRLASHTEHVSEHLVRQSWLERNPVSVSATQCFAESKQLTRQALRRVVEYHCFEMLLPAFETFDDELEEIAGDGGLEGDEPLQSRQRKRRHNRVIVGLGEVTSPSGHRKQPVEAAFWYQFQQELTAVRGHLVCTKPAAKHEVKQTGSDPRRVEKLPLRHLFDGDSVEDPLQPVSANIPQQGVVK